MTTIYIVKGQSGEYDDRKEWDVIAYFDFDKAWKHCLEAQKIATEIFNNYPSWRWPENAENNLLDTNMYLQCCGSTDDNDVELGCKYYVYHLEVIE